MPLSAAYFDALYRDDDDPWGYRHRWYERRKQQLTLAALPRERYRRAFEPACANGELTALLATRCDVLIACDLSGRAVALAQVRCASLPNVHIERRVLPYEWPTTPSTSTTPSADPPFDLIVIGELAYYLDPRDMTLLAERACASLSADGTLIACHWRHAFVERRQSAVAAHAALDACTELTKLVHHEEPDLLLDVWSKDGRSVAQREGLA
ncbi:SAM-dependent methyltransferase [Paraburkholderia rhizosphaerae]|uniref:Nodulation protein S (NodS) n=1 Tax=Paraburkholderia rhizosphaerae TaxID=480658 RepID=A0A4V3HCZ5_9BURK|nr:SAM-dependent methyltransferase [Paraburkholderia rhizosphaerae]TDY39034.1 nodulation protein S (NodS) [Paraburkholderia rhizosphaerae]